MKANPEKLSWTFISGNPYAVELLREHPDRIHWDTLCVEASNKEQFEFLRENVDRVNWDFICRNPNPRALAWLEECPERINWYYSLAHQNVFETVAEYQYDEIREAQYSLHEEFHAWAGHPSKMSTKWKDWGLEGAVDEEEEDAEL